MSSALVLYMPVIHRGYWDLIARCIAEDKCQSLYLIGEELMTELMGRPTEIRAIPAETVAEITRSLKLFATVEVLYPSSTNKSKLPDILKGRRLVMPDEAVSNEFVERFTPDSEFTLRSCFLRWEESSVRTIQDVVFDRVSTSEVDRVLMAHAKRLAAHSGDWWRQVGGLVVRNGEVIIEAWNHHVPSDLTPYIDGDPRDVIEAGVDSHITTALHCEQDMLTQAARHGISVDGSDAIVTIFPCPMCAKQVAYAGFRRVFFGGGHASLDGESILRRQGVELVYVPM